MKSFTAKTSLDFEITAAQEVYRYLVERSEHIVAIDAEVFARRCVSAAFGEHIAKQLKQEKIK